MVKLYLARLVAFAALDLKTDRKNRKLLVQKWNWVGVRKELKRPIEEELHRFERFQLAE